MNAEETLDELNEAFAQFSKTLRERFRLFPASVPLPPLPCATSAEAKKWQKQEPSLMWGKHDGAWMLLVCRVRDSGPESLPLRKATLGIRTHVGGSNVLPMLVTALHAQESLRIGDVEKAIDNILKTTEHLETNTRCELHSACGPPIDVFTGASPK